jgi:hypothetical protein
MTFTRTVTRTVIVGAIMLFAAAAAAPAADNEHGAVMQSGGNSVRQNPSLPKLNLNSAQRERIRESLLTKHTEVEFRLKTTKSAKNFTPKMGAVLPKAIKPHGLPSELRQQIPLLASYGYVKMKDQILIVNELSRKIVEIIPESPSQTTTGQR